MTTLRIGTRGSKLALWQAHHVRDRLQDAHPELTVELVIITTKGDRILDRPLALVGGKGLFVKEIEQALLDGEVDIAVHSAKDMPSELPDGLVLSTYVPRADPRDVLVSREGHALDALPEGARVGTSSLRRRAHLLAARPDLEVINLRGNLDTRLEKVATGHDGLDAAVLAYAGITRLGLDDVITEVLDTERFLPAVGQGAVVIERRADDASTAAALDAIHDEDTAIAVRAERAMLAKLEGNCHLPIAALATRDGDNLSIRGLVASPDGAERVEVSLAGSTSSPEALGTELGERLLTGGAAKLIAQVEPS